MFKSLWNKIKGKSEMERNLDFYRQYLSPDNIETFKMHLHGLGQKERSGYSMKTGCETQTHTIHPLQIHTIIYDGQIKNDINTFKDIKTHPYNIRTIYWN